MTEELNVDDRAWLVRLLNDTPPRTSGNESRSSRTYRLEVEQRVTRIKRWLGEQP